jgi:NADH:flavin oxidoreductase / NADH oxidase family
MLGERNAGLLGMGRGLLNRRFTSARVASWASACGVLKAIERNLLMAIQPDSVLFEPTIIGEIPVANRVAMAPLTRSRADMEGVHSDLAVEYYRQRATAGLIVTEATNISRQGRGFALTPGIYTDAQVEAWAHVTEAVH